MKQTLVERIVEMAWVSTDHKDRPKLGEILADVRELQEAARVFNRLYRIPKGTKPSADILMRFTAADFKRLSAILQKTGAAEL